MARLFLYILLLLSVAGSAQDIPSLLRRAAQLESAFKEKEALDLYNEVLRIDPDNVPALCKSCDLGCRIGNRETSKAQKTVYFTASRTSANRAYRLAPGNSEVNIMMALSIARMALMQGGKDKIAAAGDVKKYAEHAIRLDPANYKAYHILGRWHYEVSGLNVFERTLAKWFYGSLPQASLGEAIGYYERSMSLRPSFMLNYLELARACHRDGQKDKAVRLLRQMGTLPDGMADDAGVRAEGKKLLSEWE